jgi:hypothetical protein
MVWITKIVTAPPIGASPSGLADTTFGSSAGILMAYCMPCTVAYHAWLQKSATMSGMDSAQRMEGSKGFIF